MFTQADYCFTGTCTLMTNTVLYTPYTSLYYIYLKTVVTMLYYFYIKDNNCIYHENIMSFYRLNYICGYVYVYIGICVLCVCVHGLTKVYTLACA